MKFYLTLLFAFFLLPQSINATENSVEKPYEQKQHGFLEGKVGYFYPFSSDLREVISGGADYQISFTYLVRNQLALFTSGDFFIKDGKSSGDHSKTTLWILPITLGLKYFVPVYCYGQHKIDLSFALAPRYYLSQAINHASYVDHTNYAQGMGGMGSVAALYIYKHLSVTAFVDASFGNIHSKTSLSNREAPNIQVGGLVGGGGIGYAF